MDNQERDRWVKNFLITLAVFVLVSSYFFVRRGSYNLSVVNKALGSASILLAGITLLVGPLAKRFSALAAWTALRKHMGLTALALGLGHGMVSLFFLPSRFPFPSWFLSEWIPVGFGILAVVLWIYLWRISNIRSINSMGKNKWRTYQSVGGQLAFVAVFLHITIMKYEGWIDWMLGKPARGPVLIHPSYPPESFFVFIFMAAIIVYRGIQYIKGKSS